MSTPRSSDLPVELYRPIFQNFTAVRDLYALLGISKVFNAEAERAIYHTIIIRPLPRNNGDIALIECLASTPRLSNLVWRLNIPGIGSDQINDPVLYWKTVHRALQLMVNLRHLNIDNSLTLAHGDPLDSTCLLEGCNFQLRTLAFRSIMGQHTWLIERQAPELEDLICFHSTGYQPSAGIHYPKVKVVGFDANELVQVLDTMPHVKAVQWTGGIARLAWTNFKPFERVRTLNIHFYTTGTLPSIGACFPSLVYLKCMLFNSDRNMVLSPEEFVGVYSGGQTWGSLRKIYLQMDKARDQDGLAASYAVLFETFPTLRSIELHLKYRHVGLQATSGGKETEIVAKPQEWKEAKWFEGRTE